MRITADTNLLVRSVVQDDESQAQAAATQLRSASLIAVSTACLCEFVWVLRRVHAFSSAEAASAVETLMRIDTVVLNRPATKAGLATLEAGGDFCGWSYRL